jgi:hypothetical protein
MVLENKIGNQPLYILIYIFLAVFRRFSKKIYPFGGVKLKRSRKVPRNLQTMKNGLMNGKN